MEFLSSKLKTQLTMWSEENRKASFKDWIFSKKDKCSASKLAEAGFYFIGSSMEPDLVQCFLCSKALDQWEKDDDPWIEHKKHAPNCFFAKIGLPESRMKLVDFFDIRAELFKHVLIRHYDLENRKKVIESIYESLGQTHPEEQN